ncbi:MAG TPA: family 43 glycosylhydrolase [Acidobacteriaceae bacterium]|nr:family 43 glycosylhydrolase [Acidobacteriaceae bacterium]
MAPIGVPVAGMPFVHDPSTVVRWKGRYWVFSTGRGAPFYSSPDGATWTREGSVWEQIPEDVHAAVPKNNGVDVWAPDVIRMNGEFYLYYAVSSWGSFQSVVALATNPTLDPKDPDYKWTDRGVVVSSTGTDDLNAIDPGVMKGPDGRLWICYGSYHGSIRVTELDPKTGLAKEPGKLGAAIATARESEASDLIYRDGYYYLFVNHNSCCKGKNSEYNIRVGRAKDVLGPYVDKHGRTMAEGGGSLFLAAHDYRIGPGHFGRVVDYDSGDENDVEAGSEIYGAERFSVHYEADTTRGNRSVLDMRPLLWSTDGWPVAGDNVAEGTYQIVSRMSENTLEEIKPPANVATALNAGATAQGVSPGSAAAAAAARVEETNPAGDAGPGVGVARLTRYLTLDNQKWTIAPTGNGFYKIVNAQTGDALGENSDAAIAVDAAIPVTLKPYSGEKGQMWHLDQFPDGGWRIRNRMGASLRMGEGGGAALGNFMRDDVHLWAITTP